MTPLQVACSRPFANKDEDLFNVETIRNLLGVGAPPNLPVRGDTRSRGNTYERDAANGGRRAKRISLDILLCGKSGQLLRAEGDDDNPNKMVDDAWTYKVFVGVMELIRCGSRYSEELNVMLSEELKNIFKEAGQDWKDKTISQDDVLKYSSQLFKPINKSMWKHDSTSAACMLCEDAFSATHRRHHCRMCGILACGACTSKRLLVAPAEGVTDDQRGSGRFFSNISSGGGGPKEERICDCCFNITASHLEELQSETADRGRLMARVDKQIADSDIREVEDRAELFRGASFSADDGARGGCAHGAMGEAMDRLNDRGEKLKGLNDKSGQLQNAAADFKDMARALKEQQKKASKWGF